MKKSVYIVFAISILSLGLLQSCGALSGTQEREVGRQQNQNSIGRDNSSKNNSNRDTRSNERQNTNKNQKKSTSEKRTIGRK